MNAISTKEIVLENGHPGIVFIITEGWAWDLVDLKWVSTKDSIKGL